MEDGFMSKRFLLSASLVALLSSQAFATRQTAIDLADRESNQQAIVIKLMASNDYTFSLDEEETAERIKDAALVLNKRNEGGQESTPQQIADLKFDTKHRIRTNLDHLKTSHAPLGHGYYLTQNIKGELSTTSHRNPLVYPVFSGKGDRDAPDAFLPTTYRSNFLSKDLCDQIRYYAYNCNRNISEQDAKKLNKYLQPIFYIAQLEVMKMLEGRESLYHSPRWVYAKDRDGIVQSVRDQTSQHHALIKKADLKYFDSADVENRIVPQLVDFALKIIPTRLIELYNDGRHSFRVGKNYKSFPSLIHPQIDNLPYPVLQNNRKNGVNVVSDMNLPQDYIAHQALTNQWNRVKDFVNDDGRIAIEEKSNVIKLFEPVGYLFRNAVRDLHIVAEQYPEKEEAIERLTGLAETYALTHMIPEDVLNIFYQGGVDLHTLLQDVKVKTARHEAMVNDLFPVRLRGNLETIRNNLLESLVLHDMVDRFKLFYPYDVHRLG
ncbi:unnamed protein product [Sphagnum jensenii]|uniref:Uncharacterized protein n=1 Tax=Sphagnum jensenii TaxID=128206 RepID=A0ABP0VL87_9BRYO